MCAGDGRMALARFAVGVRLRRSVTGGFHARGGHASSSSSSSSSLLSSSLSSWTSSSSGFASSVAARATKGSRKAKGETVYVCGACGEDFPQWYGKCPSCGEWDSLKRMRLHSTAAVTPSGGAAAAARLRAPSAAVAAAASIDSPRPLRDILVAAGGAGPARLPLPGDVGAEVSRVLGGGVVPGSLVLMAGDPGVGKSTLLLQLSASLASCASASKQEVLYVTGEESAEQVGMRAARLGLHGEADAEIDVLATTNMESVIGSVHSRRPLAVVVDSIQTLALDGVTGGAGSVSQVRECASALQVLAKSLNVPVFIVGHVTKEGGVAGPKVLEHIVDTVVYIEGERGGEYRVMRSLKNRFGSVDEIGVFMMTAEAGMRAVKEVSSLYITTGTEGEEEEDSSAFSAVTAVLEGTRPVLCEVQSLVSKPDAFNVDPSGGSQAPVRFVSREFYGLDPKRIKMLLAIISSGVRIDLSSRDIFVNVTGGLKVRDTAADLGVACSIVASRLGRRIRKGTLILGELGLGGEIRPVSQMDRRLAEAARYGFTRAVVPLANPWATEHTTAGDSTLEVIRVRNLRHAIVQVLESKDEAARRSVASPDTL